MASVKITVEAASAGPFDSLIWLVKLDGVLLGEMSTLNATSSVKPGQSVEPVVAGKAELVVELVDSIRAMNDLDRLKDTLRRIAE
jgi:hypothetical protein